MYIYKLVWREMALIEKVYIDGNFRSKESNSTSQFEAELAQRIYLPSACRCYIDKTTVPHSWFSKDVNDNCMYITSAHADINGDVVMVEVLTVKNVADNALADEIK